MKLSTRGRYGVRAMLELARNYPKKTTPLKTLAHNQGISAKYLEQLLIPLKGAGLVKSVRGSRGGYQLAVHPDEVNLFQIVRVLEGPVAFVDCVEQDYFCSRRNICSVQHTWAEMSRLVRDYLSSIYLSKLLNDEQNLAKPEEPPATSKPK